MFTIFILTVFFAAAFFSAENIVTTIAGFVLTVFGTEFTKTYLKASGPLAVLLAVAFSVVLAIVGILVSAALGGDGFSADALVKQSGQIFALATLAYHVLVNNEK